MAANSDERGNDESDVLCPTVEEIKQIISQLKTRKSPEENELKTRKSPEENGISAELLGNDESDVLCPTVEEIKQIISQLKTRKSPEENGISAELLYRYWILCIRF
ncbi:hypothetical protein QE152_g34956 [Popillia japonica]|uniref:Uncharacterized protein n=1 Tax=Popillia japonica TaxID=7064 RepID=A0AAW1IT16_POPJA